MVLLDAGMPTSLVYITALVGCLFRLFSYIFLRVVISVHSLILFRTYSTTSFFVDSDPSCPAYLAPPLCFTPLRSLLLCAFRAQGIQVK